MPEALARARHEATLSAPARRGGTSRAAAGWTRLRAWLPRRPRGWASAALAAAMAGIVVNALTLQHRRHPSPFFASRPPAAIAELKSEPIAAPPLPPPPAEAPEIAASPPSPPARPARLGAAAEPTTSTRASDPIADMLRARAAKDPQKLTAAAQASLVKLGYAVKVGGVANAETLAAIRDFEKSHNLPIATEITSRLVHTLSAAAASAASASR